MKVITGIMLTLLLISTLSMAFHVVPIGWWGVTASWDGTAEVEGDVSDVARFHLIPVLDTDHPIKFGVIGPMDWIQGQGMREGAMLAAEEINEAGGILGRKVVIKTGDEGDVPERGTAEMLRLCSEEKVHFVVGGFRTEITYSMREVAMDHRIPFVICGAATTWLIDCVTTTLEPHTWPCGECVRCDYERYKYLFRVMPTNTDVLLANFLVPYLRGPKEEGGLIQSIIQPALVAAGKLASDGQIPGLPGYPERVKIGVIIENLAWTEDLRAKMDEVGPILFGPAHSTIVSKHYVSPLTKDFSPILAEMKEKGTHLIFHVFSGEEGLAFIKQWRDMEVPAVPVGINVMSQMSEMWDWTGGNCEYEAIIGWMGTRTPITPLSVPFWDAYVERWDHAPIYTSFGAYEAVYTMAEACEQAALDHPELTDPATWETLYETRELYDILIPYIENTDRIGILGRSRFTSTHDIFSGGYFAEDHGTEEYLKPLVVQWRQTAEGGRLAVVCDGKRVKTDPPPYVEDFQIPPWMLEGPPPPIEGDINGDGIVDIHDVVIVALAFGSRPGDPNWNPNADIWPTDGGDGLVDIFDLVVIGINYGKTI